MADQFDLFGARQDRDEALERVSLNNQQWMDAALRHLREVFYKGYGTLTGEDIRERLVPVIGPPKHWNAWGAFINHAISAKIITATGDYRHMHGDRSHARRTPVYRLCGGGH
jgi:hypothetical protein